ncbi:MAG: DUF3316 domain-containing protein [Bacteroidales bacterium]|nr:DUF3316 domain-containing protein [Bacteroidales bacterium]
MKFRTYYLFLIYCLTMVSVFSQTEELLHPKTFSFALGYGSANVIETYLSPYKYSGTDYRFIGEMSTLRHDEKLLTGHLLDVNYSHLSNQSGRGLYHVALVDYCYYRDYQMLRNKQWKWMMGGATNLMGGAIYNVRNSNNPAQMKAVLNLNFTNRVEYVFHIKTLPIRLVYEFRSPVLGVGFAPDFGESYYEMFQLNNTKGIVHLFSLQNQWAMQNKLTCEIPWGTTTWHIGYYSNLYQTRINQLETSLSSSNFLIGFSKDIVFVSKKRGGVK